MPVVHGHIFPEIESSGLLRREFRVLIDPKTVTRTTAKDLLDIDVLRHYLRTLAGEPYRVTLMVPAPEPGEAPTLDALFRRCNVERLSYASVVVPIAVEALGPNAPPDWLALMSTGVAADADFIVALPAPDGLDLRELGRKLNIVIGDWLEAKRNCEVFVRGHDVPWAFSRPSWNCPWTPFYSVTEPDSVLVGLWQKAASALAGC